MSDLEARALDDAFFAIVADWRRGGPGCDEVAFDRHARALFRYQIARNAPYARYAASLGYDAHREPATWREIPAVPASAFKDATLATFPIERAELVFRTSGTTAERAGVHYVERAALYDAALLAGFERFMLPDGVVLRYLCLVPNPRERKDSSLGYMVGTVAVLRGDGNAAYFLRDDAVDAEGFAAALEHATADDHPVCIAGTAFGLVALLDALDALDLPGAHRKRFCAPEGSRIMETGGFKGRTRAVARDELYAKLATTFGIPVHAIVAEYGMTELLSQYYDAPESRTNATRIKRAPPWLRTLVVDERGRERPAGDIGYLRHVDLANRSSVVAIDTEDRGYRARDGIVLLGRERDAPPRGCSLDAEELLARRPAPAAR
ncbi:MAG: acyl-protein synthetase [Vulcanimicrobiaceae bacterium]